MNHVPKGSQLHIGIFGKRNAGKSTLMNGLLRQEMSIVSPVPGTTTDSVHKSIEFHPLGPVVFVDTPGIDDQGELGELRVAKTKKIQGEIDAALWVSDGELGQEEWQWIADLRQRKVPVIIVINHRGDPIAHEAIDGIPVVGINAMTLSTLERLREEIVRQLGDVKEACAIKDCIAEGDVILLVMPQDIQAPKGRLILPQVQIIREILDAHAIPVVTTMQTLDQAIGALVEPPTLAITDSQVFDQVYCKLPKDVKLTSFSILMARQKGDLDAYVKGIERIGMLQPGDKVLIAESCTHNPLHGDIAREKIPKLLKKKLGFELEIVNVAGNQFPENVEEYKLIVQCGGCMQTRGQVMARVVEAQAKGVPITNFGVLLAFLGGILNDVFLP